MPKLAGITFNDAGHKLAMKLIAKLKYTGDVAVYGLPEMQKGKGEVRLAHHGPDMKHRKARGVFGRLIPPQAGASFNHSRIANHRAGRTQLTAKNFESVVRTANARRAIAKDRVKGFEKADPNKPGTVSGGQFESKRRKH